MSTAPEWWNEAGWPSPAAVRAGITLRTGGCSRPPFDGFNLADHVEDEPESVRENRQVLVRQLGLPAEPHWLRQRHGSIVVDAAAAAPLAEADGCYTDRPGIVCAVLTADCVPLLLCDTDGTRVAAVHVGWRGVCRDVIGSAVSRFHSPGRLLAWIGPHIRPSRYTVHDDVRDACLECLPGAEPGFTPVGRGVWQADLGTLVKLRLRGLGVTRVHADGRCTFEDPGRFYSYRRDGRTGRMASLIWISGRPG